MQPPLTVEGIEIAYGDQVLVKGFGLHVDAGESVALMGPSGSGKTSLLHCLVGLSRPAAGEIRIAGNPMTGVSAARRADARRGLIGTAYQTPDLLAEVNVAENVAITLLFEGAAREDALAAARRSLAAVGVEHLAERGVANLSGGEAQRVSLARALVRESMCLLVADEPTASLDGTNAVRLSDLMTGMVRERGIGAVIATHDQRVADRCDRVVELRDVTVR
ncbi:ABC transporter ATP-binding protein [Myceligenerans indicum]|uniref:ATP-binding cassette domain-containing protein n=1 Tax=Myceligenerans indicum TaxID=2593663 RepID=A0ABS1LLN5_9MICO|nr:ATP-binding cassette domain-containing protein [Myceligenerans indicum]MBL0887144.1 ATP-binding cassette domain-containing protein [Myceligenerans indicum]